MRSNITIGSAFSDYELPDWQIDTSEMRSQ
jgi:hypothetical protein